MGAAIAASPQSATISSDVTSQLELSYASATTIAQQYPQYADQIIAAAKTAFLEGDQNAYIAGILAVILGAVMVYFFFPKSDDERKVLMKYHQQDSTALNEAAPDPATAQTATSEK
jgi:DHA2 family multidrug resistance protein-like MFS transporter